MKVDKADWVEVGGQVSQASTHENKISKSSVFLPNALKQKQKSSSKPTHIAPKISFCLEKRGCAIWGFCSPRQPRHQNLSRKFSGKVNNLFCLLLLTQNKTWVEGRKEGAVFQESVKSSSVVFICWKRQFSREPLKIKQQTARHGSTRSWSFYPSSVLLPVGAQFFLTSLLQRDSSIISTFHLGSHFQAYSRDAFSAWAVISPFAP